MSTTGDAGRISPGGATGASTATLRKIIDASRRLDELSTARVVEQIAEAVHKLQKNGQPLHTLSPEAIVVGPGGATLEIPTAPISGYAAPEKLAGSPGDRRSDVYSLGVILWEALAHERLSGDYRPAAESNANVPAELDAICQKALAKDPGARFHSTKVMAAEISTVLDDAGYPDDNDQIAAYLREALAPVSSGASLAAKLAAAPAGSSPAIATGSSPAVSRAALNQTILGMAPIKDPAEPVVELTQEKVVELTSPKPEPAKSDDHDKKKFSGKKYESKKHKKKSTGEEKQISDAKPAAEPNPLLVPTVGDRAKQPSSQPLSPTAFSKPAEASASIAGIAVSPSTPWGAPSASSAGLVATPGAVPIVQPPIIPATAEKPSILTADPMRTLPFGSNAISAEEIAAAAATMKPKEETKPPVTIATAETVATPALVPAVVDLKKTVPDGSAEPDVLTTLREAKPLGLRAAEESAPAVSVPGLPAMPPGATLPPMQTDDFATSAGAKKYPDGPPAMPAPVAPAPPIVAADPVAAVSLPMPRKRSDTGGDLLERWASSTDSHEALVDDIDHVAEDNRKQKKRLILAIGGAFAALMVVAIVAFAAGGSDEKKDQEKDETAATIDGPSRTAAEPAPIEPAAKTSDSPPAEPAAGVEPTPTEPAGSADPAAQEAERLAAEQAELARVEAAKVEEARLAKEAADKAALDQQATKAEQARLAKDAADKAAAEQAEQARLASDAAKAKAEEQRLAKAEADKAAKAKAEEARLAKAETDKAARAKAEEARLAKAETDKAAKAKAEEARLAKAAKAEEARLAKADAAAKAKADAAAKQAAAPKTETPKRPKKEKKVAATDATPIDPYAEAPKPKVDPASAYKTGFQQYVRGDTSGALTTFKDSLSANPGYPPTYRGLGLVYEKMGQKSQAKRAFSRYLQLSPAASDAEQIRDRMARL